MVLYRKYRPQKLAELDLISVRERLINVLSSSFLPHAFLFAGPKGTGKTSSARIVAKVLNCEKNSISEKEKNPLEKKCAPDTNIEPCNKCETCTSITEGRNLDIFEIDAASNRGIDEIRDLREKIKLSPISARYKVYIIDEVHMLTTEAFNALLKTLEEPPQFAVFILATTQPEKLPETVSSRCLKLSFIKATKTEIMHSLSRVVKGEKIEIASDFLELLSEFADGSFRDATKMLEQAISEKALTREKILATFGRDNLQIEKFLDLLFSRRTKELLELILELSNKGTDFKFFLAELLNSLHRLLLSYYKVVDIEYWEKWSDKLTIKDINAIIRLITTVYSELKSSGKPELPLEVAVIEWCEQENPKSSAVPAGRKNSNSKSTV
ncbi:DNA polymerase III, subunit gamma and tau [Candidatus Gottesmanbacteria bacterium RBG_13_37_7]|uniref:DNA polymerase III subunit gamma/tau n=1 Tax=Candidatus Gottesmanbacteria bacterium RBG_13_37_7 TaxID=1798369 RepID=A0A1F5YGG9_9BACT|nr:MAG: DNA polymerase III, subunit gamma and tau [Candidatus Gottesmanbacteria bacterium RBG_13_37_7]